MNKLSGEGLDDDLWLMHKQQKDGSRVLCVLLQSGAFFQTSLKSQVSNFRPNGEASSTEAA